MHSFKYMIKNINNKFCTLEYRIPKYMFGAKNYGDIPGYINAADGDPWDVMIPGYSKLPINKKFKIKKLEAILFLPNGNHKFFIDIYSNLKRNKDIKVEIERYKNLYHKYTKLKGIVIYCK